MKSRSEKSIGQVAGDDRRLSALMRAASAFEALEQRLGPLLAAEWRDQIRVACIEEGCLMLAARSPAWATRARLQADQLLEAAREIWPGELREVKVVVVPALPAP